MDFHILQENLIKALQKISHFIPQKPQIPILSNILLESKEGKLTIFVTDLQSGVRVQVPGKMEKEGSVAVPAKTFIEYISVLPAGKLQLIEEEGKLHIITSEAKTTLQTAPVADFPSFPSKSEQTITIDKKTFTNGIVLGGAASGIDETRPMFSSILLRFQKNALRIVSTDGYRLAEKTIEKITNEKEKDVIVSAKQIKEIARVAEKEAGEKITICFPTDSHIVTVEVDDTEWFVREVEGDYPNYKAIIPPSFSIQCSMDINALQQAVKTAMVLGKDASGIIRFEFEKEKLVIHSSAAVGEHASSLQIQFDGDPQAIAFNGRYILDLLSLRSDGEISFSMNESLKPGMFAFEDDSHFFYVVMPFKV